MSEKPVLGLFESEAELRDHIAAYLEVLEEGLELAHVEYPLENPHGAGGRLDIMALDRLDHVVAIEIKRSDQSARQTLNELAKYISLLVNEARVPREAVRCFVLSTHWTELLLPFSFFAATAGVHVEGRKLIRSANTVAYEPVELVPIADQPQLSPEVSIYHYPSVERREAHVAMVAKRAEQMPFVRLALLRLDPPPGQDLPAMAIGCTWRLKLGDETRVEAVTGEPVGHLFPYGFPGWEAECDSLFWLSDETYPAECGTSGEDLRGTPEKIANYLRAYAPAGMARFGEWPKLDIINTQERILRQLVARSSLSGSPRANRHSFRQTLNPAIKPSWQRGVEAFLTFIGFEPVWANAARTFLSADFPPGALVHLHAFDKPNPFYLLHQARHHREAVAPYFEIFVSAGGDVLEGLTGCWAWDGQTYPTDPEADIKAAFGSIEWAIMSCWSAVDKQRYERAYYGLGLQPFVARLVLDQGQQSTVLVPLAGAPMRPWREFVASNTEYIERVSDIFGSVPTGPPSFDEDEPVE